MEMECNREDSECIILARSTFDITMRCDNVLDIVNYATARFHTIR